MKKMIKRSIIIAALAVLAALTLASCFGNVSSPAADENSGGKTVKGSNDAVSADAVGISADVTDVSAELLTERDTIQTPDLSEAENITLADGEDVEITHEGVYVLTGTASDAAVIVNAGKEEDVQLVADGISITNTDFPGIYVKCADKVFITTTDTENSITVTDSFRADGETETDAAIFSKEDLVLNGVGSLSVSSTKNGITSKDDLKITGGTLSVSCTADALEANDSVVISDGNITVSTRKDGIHSEYDEDSSVGSVTILGGTVDITAGDDGIHATTTVRIDDGDITIDAAEGIEGTQVTINGGTIDITASDDGINGARKSSLAVKVVFNGGYTKITMGQGDTDGVDSNGDLYINGGTVDVTGQSPFDYDGTASYNGGTIIVNGEETDTITNQFAGGGHGGMQGEGPGGMPGGAPGGMQGGPGGGGPGGRP